MLDQGVKRMTGRVCLFILSAGVLAVIGAAGFAVGSDRAPERGDGRSLGPGEEDSQACCCSLSEFPCDDASPGTLPLFAGRDEAGVSEITGKGMYLGQRTPGLVPEVFAPGIISAEDRYAIGIAFSPDGQECYFAERTANWSASWIMMTVCRDGVWTTPQKAPFSNERSLCPSVSADGKHLFFSSNRGTAGKQGIWQCTRTAGGDWSEPAEMPRQVSSEADEWSCHLSDLGNMFVCSWRDGGAGKCDEWRIAYRDGQFQTAENLRILNTGTNDCGVAPGPHEAYVIFQSDREGGPGKTDLYISYVLPEGGWSAPRNLGAGINSPQVDAAPWISYDGQYLFFSSTRGKTIAIYWVQTRAFLREADEPAAGQ